MGRPQNLQFRPESACSPSTARGQSGRISSLPRKCGPLATRGLILVHKHYTGLLVPVYGALQRPRYGRGPGKAAICCWQHD